MAFLLNLLTELLFWLFTIQVTKRVETPDPLRDRLLSDPYYGMMAR